MTIERIVEATFEENEKEEERMKQPQTFFEAVLRGKTDSYFSFKGKNPMDVD